MNLVSLLLQTVIIMESNELKKMAESAIKTSKDLNENFGSIIEDILNEKVDAFRESEENKDGSAT